MNRLLDEHYLAQHSNIIAFGPDQVEDDGVPPGVPRYVVFPGRQPPFMQLRYFPAMNDPVRSSPWRSRAVRSVPDFLSHWN